MMTALQTIAVAFAMFSALPMPQFDWNAKNMRYALCAFPLVGAVCGALWCLCGMLPLPALAWDGFDADSADLVEIIPDALPNKGDTVDVRNYSNDETTTCLVVSVTRNSRTVEIVVRTPDGEAHTLVMEGR